MDFRSLNIQDADADESFDAPLRGFASSNRPRPTNPFGTRNTSWVRVVLGCLTSLMDFMGKLLTSLQPPPTIKVNGKTYTIVKPLGEGGNASKISFARFRVCLSCSRIGPLWRS